MSNNGDENQFKINSRNSQYSVIDEAANLLISTIANYGWYIVAFVVISYYISPYVQYASDRISLAQANSASRRAILDEDRKRARMIQQLDVYKANKSFRDIEKGSKTSSLSKQN